VATQLVDSRVVLGSIELVINHIFTTVTSKYDSILFSFEYSISVATVRAY
jgi:hypothetical protein